MQLLAGMASAVLLLASAIPAPAATIPPYATPLAAAPAPPADEAISGTIVAQDAKYHLRLHDQRGYLDDVTLHDGTVIEPRGLRLKAGMFVTIRGAAQGRTFAADEIDAPLDYLTDQWEAEPSGFGLGVLVLPLCRGRCGHHGHR